MRNTNINNVHPSCDLACDRRHSCISEIWLTLLFCWSMHDGNRIHFHMMLSPFSSPIGDALACDKNGWSSARRLLGGLVQRLTVADVIQEMSQG